MLWLVASRTPAPENDSKLTLQQHILVLGNIAKPTYGAETTQACFQALPHSSLQLWKAFLILLQVLKLLPDHNPFFSEFLQILSLL